MLKVNSSPHEITISSSIPRISGAVVSRIRKVACASEELPHSSVAVNITSVMPSQLKLGPAKSFVKLICEQSSVATLLPLLLNHAWISAAKLGSAQSTVRSEGSVVNSGAVVSSIVTVPMQVVDCPQLSVAVNITSTDPVLAEQPPKKPIAPKLLVIVTSLHSEVAVAEANQAAI